MNKLYAVYGTLRKSFGNHRLIEHCELVFEGKVDIPFEMISLSAFPGLIPSEDSQDIYLEVYKFEDELTERQVDGLEGYPHFYDKTIINTPAGEAYVYFLHRDGSPESIVEGGDWLEFVNQHREPKEVY